MLSNSSNFEILKNWHISPSQYRNVPIYFSTMNEYKLLFIADTELIIKIMFDKLTFGKYIDAVKQSFKKLQ